MRKLGSIAALVLWVGGVGWPLFRVFSGEGRILSWAHLTDVSVLLSVRSTLIQAGLSTLVSGGIGVALGLVFAAVVRGRKLRGWVWFLLSVPFSIPSLLAASAWTTLYAQPGWAGWGYQLVAVVIAHVFFNVPLVALWTWQAIERVPQSELELGRSLGLNSRGLWRWVIFPRARSAIAAVLLQVFQFCASSFVLVMVLGGGPAVQTLETAIFAEVRFGLPDLPKATALALWQMAIQALPWIALALWVSPERPRSVEISERRDTAPASLPAGTFALLLASIWLLPYLVMFRGSWGGALSYLEWAVSAAVSIGMALGVSALTLMWVGLGFVALTELRRAGLKWGARSWWLALQAPAAFSSIVLSLGFVLAYPRSWGWGVGSVAIVQSILFVPLALRLLWGEYTQSSATLHEVARSLGASPQVRWLKIEWPRWRGPVISVGAWIGVAALGEIAIWSFFQPAGNPSLPALLARWMSQYRFEEAQGGALLLLAISIVTLVLAGRGWKRSL